jgi:peptidoglycan/LPS O-acetylase OafA/YrhL
VLSWGVFGYFPTVPKLLRSLLLIYSWLMPAQNLLINGAIWSLHVEWAGYFAFPWICLLLVRIRSWRTAAILAVAVIAVETTLMLLNGAADPGGVVAGPGAFGRMAGGFVLGCLLWVGFQHRAARRVSGDRQMLASVGAIIVILLLTDPVYTLAPMALVVLLAARPGRVTAWLLGHPVCGFLGRISFSLYMIHQPIVHVFQHLQHTTHTLLPGGSFSAGALVTALIVASVICIGAEEKLRRFGRRLTPPLQQHHPGQTRPG